MASKDTVHIVAALVASRNFQVDLERGETIPVFDRENWQPRTDRQHRSNARRLPSCKTVAARNKRSREFCIAHRSCLLEVEYFDIIRFCTVDPMHNLFLGTAKYVFKLWDKQGVIAKKEMKRLEKHIEEMDVPTDMGRLPKKISSNYGSYTAEQ